MADPNTPDPAELDELRRLVGQYEVMLANVSDTVVLIGRDAQVRMTTGLRNAMLGYGDGYWEHHGLLDVVHPDDLDEVLRIREQLAQRKGEPITFRVRMQHFSGEWLHIEVTAVDCSEEPLFDDIVLTVRDVTERLRIGAQLEAQAQRQVELVGRVSH
ncbi:MAG: PAS domain-containing protein, partial [Actinomycetes bacterium]